MTAGGLVEAHDAVARCDWQAAFDLAGSPVADNPALDADRLNLLADAAWWLGRFDQCISAREAAYRAFDDLGERRRAGKCAVLLYEDYSIVARPAIAGAWLRRAQRALGDEPDCVENCALMMREAEIAHGRGESDQALAIAARARVMGTTLGSPDMEAEALQTTGRMLVDVGRVAEGMGYLDEAMLFALEGRLGPYSTGKVYCSLIAACEATGDLDRAAEWTEATMRWAHQHPFAIFPGICRVHRAVVLERRGHLAEAEHEAELACAELSTSHVGVNAAAFAQVGEIRRRLGELDRADEAFAAAQQLCGQPCGGLALLRLAQGRTDAARAIIDSCLRQSTSMLARARLLPVCVHVAIAAGDVDAARHALAELDDISETYGTPFLRAVVLSTRGRLELARHDAASADTLGLAVECWQALDVPYEVATARTLQGQALRERGEEAGAADCFGAAVQLFDQIGARLDARLVLDGATPVLPARLTQREVEVLRAIAAGMSNSGIAAALHLSTKTVSRHLSNIFTKIGVTSRAGATAFAFENELVDPTRRVRPGS